MGFLKELCVWGGLNMCQYVYEYVMYYILLENTLDGLKTLKYLELLKCKNIFSKFSLVNTYKHIVTNFVYTK